MQTELVRAEQDSYPALSDIEVHTRPTVLKTGMYLVKHPSQAGMMTQAFTLHS